MKVVSTGLLLALGASPAKAFVSQSRSSAFSRSASKAAKANTGANNVNNANGIQNVKANSNTALASSQADTAGSAYEDALSNYASQAAPTSPMAKDRSRPNPMTDRQSQMSAVPVTTIQGGSLKTWALKSAAIERVEINLGTEGRPLDADIDLWHGPDNTPNRMRVYVEDGAKRPFSAVIETPRGPNTVAVRNIGQMEFPMEAQVMPNPNLNAMTASDMPGMTIQGGALKTFPFEQHVESVQLMIRTDGRPMNARIELLQGPNNIKQVMELYIEDGMDRPFFAIIKTPGSGNVIRIVNTSPVEFPMVASIDAHEIGNFDADSGIVIGGDGAEGFGARDMQW